MHEENISSIPSEPYPFESGQFRNFTPFQNFYREMERNRIESYDWESRERKNIFTTLWNLVEEGNAFQIKGAMCEADL